MCIVRAIFVVELESYLFSFQPQPKGLSTLSVCGYRIYIPRHVLPLMAARTRGVLAVLVR